MDAKNKAAEFASYKNTTKREWISEKRDLDTLLGNIQTKLKTYNLRPYHPPDGHTLSVGAPTTFAISWSRHVNTLSSGSGQCMEGSSARRSNVSSTH